MTDTTRLFLTNSATRLTGSIKTLSQCLDRLTDEQVWYRGGAHENAIGNLVLHLSGNMRQWIIAGVGGQPDIRTRDAEFSASGSQTRAQLLALYRSTIEESIVVIDSVSDSRLAEIIHPQQRTVTVFEAIYTVVGHVQMHLGQIIVLTKQITASDLDLTIPRPRQAEQ